MHRTQIMLDEPQYRFLLDEARRGGSSIAAVIRRLVAEHMAQRGPQEEDPLERIIGIAASGGGVAEADHDRIVYGFDET
jgi:hypothetical protein